MRQVQLVYLKMYKGKKRFPEILQSVAHQNANSYSIFYEPLHHMLLPVSRRQTILCTLCFLFSAMRM